MRCDIGGATTAESNLRDMVEFCPAGLGVATFEGAVLEVNPALCTLLGRSREQVVGRLLSEFIHPDDRPRAGASLVGLFDGTGSDRVVVELRFVQGDGRVVEVETMAALRRDLTGCPDRIIAVIHDISERRNAERARLEI